MALPESVIACECWARDGLQSMPVLVSTDDKVEMLNRIVRSGFKKLEVTSFSHPKLLPQFADAADVLRRIERRPGVSYVILMPNSKGFDRFETVPEGRLRRRRDHPDDLVERGAQHTQLPGDARRRRWRSTPPS